MNLCSRGVCRPLASVFPFFFPFGHGDGRPFPHWLVNRVEAAVVTLTYLSTDLFAFHLTLRTGNEFLFWDTWRGKILHPEVMQLINKKKCSIFLSWAFQEWPNYSWATCGAREGFAGQAQRTHSSGREWKCSVMVEHGRLVVIRDHLFLSEHKAPAFALRDRWISGSELDRGIKGDTLINEILWHWDVWWLPGPESFFFLPLARSKKKQTSSVSFFSLRAFCVLMDKIFHLYFK